MIYKNIQQYADLHWKEYQACVTDISCNDNNQPLVESEHLLHNFDSISQALYGNKNAPTSADGISITPNIVQLIEFKSGFKKRITRRNFDRSLGTCPKAGQICNEYWDLFFKSQQNDIKALIDSIRFKAIESYITLEKKILPLCEDFDHKQLLKLTVVIDEDGVDSMEDTLAELAGSSHQITSNKARIEQALKRLGNQQDANGQPYYYDVIAVLSACDYSNMLQTMS